MRTANLSQTFSPRTLQKTGALCKGQSGREVQQKEFNENREIA